MDRPLCHLCCISAHTCKLFSLCTERGKRVANRKLIAHRLHLSFNYSSKRVALSTWKNIFDQATSQDTCPVMIDHYSYQSLFRRTFWRKWMPSSEHTDCASAACLVGLVTVRSFGSVWSFKKLHYLFATSRKSPYISCLTWQAKIYHLFNTPQHASR